MSAFHTSLNVAAERQAARAGRTRQCRRPSRGWLPLAAAPTFAIMALLTVLGGGAQDMLCSGAQAASPLSGMLPMYLLMSAFHSAPWLKLISGSVARALAHGGPRSYVSRGFGG